MSVCPCCGHEESDEFKRGPWLARSGPLDIFYHGLRVAMSPSQAALMALLIRRGSVSMEAAQAVATGPECALVTLHSVINNTRKRLKVAAVSDWRIKSDCGKLRLEPVENERS